MSDVVLLSLIGIKVVLIHGGGPGITPCLDRVGLESKFVNGLRYTDGDTAEIVQMVLAGKVNQKPCFPAPEARRQGAPAPLRD